MDVEDKFDAFFKPYFSTIPGPSLILAGNTIGAASQIALAKPDLIDKITKEILKVENAKYKTDECRNVAIGQAISSFTKFYDQITDKKSVNKFVKKQKTNTRSAVRKKAEAFIKQFGIG